MEMVDEERRNRDIKGFFCREKQGGDGEHEGEGNLAGWLGCRVGEMNV